MPVTTNAALTTNTTWSAALDEKIVPVNGTIEVELPASAPVGSASVFHVVAGSVTFTAPGGVNLRNRAGDYVQGAQYGTCAVWATAADEWLIDGTGDWQPLDSDLTAIAALTTTTFGRSLLALADAAALRTAINVEDGADVTDTANVTAAGALMDSEVDADIKTLALPANTTITAFGASLVDDADAVTARATLDVDQAGTDNSTDVTLAGTPDYITISGQTITRNPVDLAADVSGELPTANIADEAVTNAKLAHIATDRIKGRVSSGTGDVEDLTAAQGRDVLQAVGPVFDVTHSAYGATGDGTTDDTAACLAAVAACVAAGGGIVWFPPGIYAVDGQIGDIDVNGVHIVGAGKEATILKITGNLAAPLISVSGTTLSALTRDGSISDMTIWGQSAGYTGTLIDLNAVSNYGVGRVKFTNHAGAAINMVEVWDSHVEFCEFNDCGNESNTQAQVQSTRTNGANADTGCNNVTFVACQFEAPNWVNTSLGEHTRRFRFEACKWHAKPTPGSFEHVRMAGAYLNSFTGCTWASGTADHVTIASSANQTNGGNVFTGCTVSNGDAWINIASTSRHVIVGNVIGIGGGGTTTSLEIANGSTLNVFAVNTDTTTNGVVDGNTPPQYGVLAFYDGAHVYRSNTSGAVIQRLLLDTGSPADFQAISSTINFMNDADEETIGLETRVITQDVTNGTEDSAADLYVMRGGTWTRLFRIDGAENQIRAWAGLRVDGALDHDGSTVGFFGTTPAARPTGVAVTAEGIHAALVSLGLITA